MKDNQKQSIGKRIKRMFAVPILSAALAFPANAGADERDTMYKTAGVNIALNGLIGGIGSNVHGRGFWEGFRKGSLAGSIMYAGKYGMYNYVDQNGLPLLGKAVHALGASMRDNVYNGREALDTYSIDLGPVSLRYDRDLKNFDWKILPSSVIGLGYGFSKGKINAKDTLNTGNFVFHTGNDEYLHDDYRAATIGNTLVLNNEGRVKSFGHELVHTGQDREFGLAGIMLSNKLNGRNNWLAKLNKRIDIGRGLADLVHSFYNEANYEKSVTEYEADYGYRKSK